MMPIFMPSTLPGRAAATRSSSGIRQGGGIVRVVAADDLVQQGRVQHRAGDGADLVQRGGHRDGAVAGDAAVGGLDAHGAGDGAGLADGPAGVRAEGQRALRRRRRRQPSRRRNRPGCVAGGLGSVAAKLGADLVVCVDVGGDVLGTGAEPGLASPLCDAVMLAAAAELQRTGTRTVAAVFGPCCDGELTVEELLERLAALGRAGALLGTSSLAGAVADELERAIAQVPTEASAQALRCARGEVGWTTIRAGRRKVFMSPLGALSFYFDPMRAMEEAAPLARAVRGAHSLDQANEALHAAGVRTELDYERSAVEA